MTTYKTDNDTPWKIGQIKDVANVNSGFGFPLAHQGKTEGKYPFIKVRDISETVQNGNTYISSANNYIDEQTLKSLRAVPFSAGTVVFAKIGEALKLNRRAILLQETVVDNNVMGVSPKEGIITSEYLFHFLKTVNLATVSRSTTVPSIRKTDVENFEIKYPDIATQKKVGLFLTNATNQITTGLNKISNTKLLITKFRQAILRAAITGKLTEDWREKNLNKPKTTINYVTQANKPKVQFGLSQFETYDLPEEWEWKQFWEAAEIKSNLVKPDKYPNYVLVAPDNIERNTGRLLEKKLVSEVKPISAKHLFFAGQIVYSKIRPYLSKLILSDFDGLCSADMYPISTRVNVRYVMLFMLSKYFLDNVSNLGTRTLLPKTNQEELNSIPVPVPSLEEQEQIVKKVDYYLNIAQAVEKQILKAETRVSKLTQAVLAKTFKS